MRIVVYLLLTIPIIGAAPTADQCAEEMKRALKCLPEMTKTNGSAAAFDSCFGFPKCTMTKEIISMVSNQSRKWAAILQEINSCVTMTKFNSFMRSCKDQDKASDKTTTADFACISKMVKKENCTDEELKKFNLMKKEFDEMDEMNRKYMDIIQKVRKSLA